MGVGGRELDKGFVAVLVLERGRLLEHAVRHLLKVAVAREHDGDRVLLDLGLQAYLDDLMGLNPARAARHHVLLVDRCQLVADDLLDVLFAGEDLLKLGNLALELGDVLGAVENVLFVDVAELKLGDKLGLGLVDVETLHKVGYNLCLELSAADDGDGLVDVEQNCLKAVQQVQALGLFAQVKVNAATRGRNTPLDPLVQNLAHAHNTGIAVDEHVEVARERILQRGRAIELGHELVGVDAALKVDGDAQTRKVGLVADVGDLLDLALLGELDDAFDDDIGLGGVGDLVHLDDALFGNPAPAGANLEAAKTGLDDLLHLLAAVDNLAAGREIGHGHVLEQVAVGVLQVVHRGGADLVEVEAADIGRHSDADALVGRDEDVGERGGQQTRLLHGTVVAVNEVDRVLVDVFEDLGADGGELGLGITRGGVAQVARIVLAKVALRLHERSKQRLVARGQAHHRLVDGGVAVWVELHGLAHDVGALLALALEQAHLVHSVEQLAVRGLKAVDLGECTRDVDAHSVGHVVDLERLRNRLVGDLGVQADDVLGVDLLFLGLVLRLLLCHDFLLNFLWAVVIDLLLLQVQLVQVFLAVLGDVTLAARLVVTQQQVEHGLHLGDVLGFYLDQAARLGVHGGEPHHVRIVLTKTLGAVDRALLVANLLEDAVLLELGVGKVGLLFAVDLVERRLGDIHVALVDKRGHQAIEHGEHKRADVITVDVGVRTDDDLVPVEVVQVKGAKVLDALVLDLHTAAQHAHEVHDDVGLKDARVVLFQTVEDLASDGHNTLELGIARGADGACCRVALYDVDLATALVLGAAVDELLHAVGHVGLLLQVGLNALAGLFGVLARALVDEHLLHDLVGGVFVLDQIGREALLKECRHRLLDKAVIDGLLSLVFVGRLGGEAVGHQHQTVLDVLPLNAALVFVVLALLLDVGIDGAGQSTTGGLFGRTAVLEP